MRLLIALIGGFATTVAWAQAETSIADDPDSYLTLLPFYVDADDGRGATDDGQGISIGYGRHMRGRWYWEGQVFADVLDTGEANFTDFYQHGLGLDLHYRFRSRAGASPFVLLGGGLIRNDVVPSEDDAVDLFANIGLGFVTRELGRAGLRLRADLRYVHDEFETQGVSGMSDWHLGLGVQIPLGRRVVEREVVREVVRDRVVTETLPAEITDSDNDGVPDEMDRCPGTPGGMATDNRGCAADGMQSIRLEGVNFETNSARLIPSTVDPLRRLAATLRSQPNLRGEIAGPSTATTTAFSTMATTPAL